MIGRYKNLGVYKEIVSSKDFLRIISAVFCIILAVFVEKVIIIHMPDNFSLGGKLVANVLMLTAVSLTGLPIVLEAIQGLLEKRINVDELVSIAIIACILTGNYLEAAIVSTIMVSGAMIEEAVSDSARNAIKKLIAMTPEKAIVLRSGAEVEVDVKDLIQGEILVIRPGETIPVDAVIHEGRASIDESSITGESIPVVKLEDSMLYAGTINSDGYIKARVEKVGKDSTLGKIIAMVEAAESSKIDSARIVDRYARWFTPTILALAILTFLITRDSSRAITILIVGCPCSFLLAGPVPTIASIGRAAKSGIMIKGGTFLEDISRSTAIYFDKTGTVTHGEPEVTSIEAGPDYTPESLLRLAASVEKGSLHPLAKAIVAKAEELNIPISEARDIKVLAGTGIEGIANGKKVFIGAASVETADGETVVDVSVDGRSVGCISLRDRVRENARATIEHIRKLGIRDIAIISGDFHSSVEKVAVQIGVDTYHSRLKPADKFEKIESYDNGVLMYIGDGINDAPALKKAAVGIAMGSKGADIALETADIVLMNDRLDLLPFLIRLSRKMTRTIRINILLSFTINLLSITAGFTGILTPILGALSHNIGSILVVMLSASLTLQKEEI